MRSGRDLRRVLVGVGACGGSIAAVRGKGGHSIRGLGRRQSCKVYVCECLSMASDVPVGLLDYANTYPNLHPIRMQGRVSKLSQPWMLEKTRHEQIGCALL